MSLAQPPAMSAVTGLWDPLGQVTNNETQLENQHKNIQPQQELKKCEFK